MGVCSIASAARPKREATMMNSKAVKPIIRQSLMAEWRGLSFGMSSM